MIFYFLLFHIAVIFDAIGDSLSKQDKIDRSKIFQHANIGVIFIMIFLAPIFLSNLLWYEWIYFIGMYVFLRVALFNIIWSLTTFDGYNNGKKLYWWYVGRRDWFDRMLDWIMTKLKAPRRHFLFWFYLLSYLFALFILIQGFYVISI